MPTDVSEPTYSKALELVDEAARRRLAREPDGFDEKTWRAHIAGVAESARVLAARLPGIDPERMRVFGLLHDIGKRWSETARHVFHGLSGYHYMKAFGYRDTARICLTHSFILKDNRANLLPNPDDTIGEAYALLKDIPYNDEDRLIQLCDWLNDCGTPCTIAYRASSIIRRYPAFDPERTLRLAEAVQSLKSEFDRRCGEDVYTVLGIASFDDPGQR